MLKNIIKTSIEGYVDMWNDKDVKVLGKITVIGVGVVVALNLAVIVLGVMCLL